MTIELGLIVVVLAVSFLLWKNHKRYMSFKTVWASCFGDDVKFSVNNLITLFKELDDYHKFYKRLKTLFPEGIQTQNRSADDIAQQISQSYILVKKSDYVSLQEANHELELKIDSLERGIRVQRNAMLNEREKDKDRLLSDLEANWSRVQSRVNRDQELPAYSKNTQRTIAQEQQELDEVMQHLLQHQLEQLQEFVRRFGNVMAVQELSADLAQFVHADPALEKSFPQIEIDLREIDCLPEIDSSRVELELSDSLELNDPFEPDIDFDIER